MPWRPVRCCAGAVCGCEVFRSPGSDMNHCSQYQRDLRLRRPVRRGRRPRRQVERPVAMTMNTPKANTSAISSVRRIGTGAYVAEGRRPLPDARMAGGRCPQPDPSMAGGRRPLQSLSAISSSSRGARVDAGRDGPDQASRAMHEVVQHQCARHRVGAHDADPVCE